MQRELHPYDHDRLRRLGEALCDLSAGRPIKRKDIENRVALMMACVRSDSAATRLEAVVDRLLGLADWRSGSEAMAEAAHVEILIDDPALAGLA